jgi:hypothetical protein
VLERSAFFLRRGIGAFDELIELVYDVARYWRIDPEIQMTRPLSILFEQHAHAFRQIEISRSAND